MVADDSSPATNRTVEDADADQTNEYNNSLVFGDDSSKLHETQNVGQIIDVAPNGHNGGETSGLTAKGRVMQTQADTGDRTPFIERFHYEFDETDPNIQSSPTTRNNDTQVIPPPIDDTQVIRQQDDTQILQTRGDADTQVIQQHILDDTQIIEPLRDQTQELSIDVPVGIEVPVPGHRDHRQVPVSAQRQANDDTQVINAPSDESSPLSRVDSVSFRGDIDTSMDKDKSSSSAANTEERGFLTFSQPDTSKSGSHPSSNPHGNTSNDAKEVILTSPQNQFTKSMLEIPGTVEKTVLPETQVFQTQEEEMMDIEDDTRHVSDKFEMVDTDDEEMALYDDSILAHKRKLKNRLPANSSSPTKAFAQVAASPPPSIFEESKRANLRQPDDDDVDMAMAKPKRQKLNVLDTQSQPKATETDDLNKKGTTQAMSSQLLKFSEVLSQSSNQMLTCETTTVLVDDDVVSKKSVWAIHQFRLYPGMVLSVGNESSEVLFEEGSFDIGNNDLFPLDLRVGDVVRIKNELTVYEVVGLVQEPSQPESEICCVRGYHQLCVQRKTSQKTRRASKDKEVKIVSLSSICMELDDWYQHQQQFTVKIKAGFSPGGSITSMINDNMKTPTRKRHVQEVRYDSRASPRSKADVKDLLKFRNRTGVFGESLFCMTAVEDDTKRDLTKVIENNGGVVLEGGFMDLFEYHKAENLKLTLRDETKLSKLKFVCLIASGVSRSSKYLQTLALGWPVISDRFIIDVAHGTSDLDHWPAYLLSAGKSSIIQGIKSLDVYRFQERYYKKFTLPSQVNLNERLLSEYSIVALSSVVNEKESPTLEFIFHAFGARNFVVKDTEAEIMDLFHENVDHSRVLVYDNSRTLKNRKMYNIIDWEWVVQCCISTHIWT